MYITENVYLLESTKGAYVYLIKAEKAVLIDTGFSWKSGAILRELRSLGVGLQDVEHILLTHGDLDHVGNAVTLQSATGAHLWASGEEIPYITGDLPRPGFKKYLAMLFRVRKPEVIQPYMPGQNIQGIEVIPAPGHTPGHVCLLYRGVLFVGDLLENRNGKLNPYPRGWNWDNSLMSQTIEQIASLPHSWVCPAHGEPIEGSVCL